MDDLMLPEPFGFSDRGSTAKPFYTADQMREYAKKAVEAERERIQDEFSMSVQSDLEHGVKSLNEKAAKDFQANYPELNKFWGWLNALD